MTASNIAFLVAGLIVGLLSAVKGTPVDAVKPFANGPLPAVDEPGFRTAIELVSRTALHPGHEVETFVNGDETYPRLWDDLRGAQRSITIQLYYCEPGRMADTLSEILVDRARARVQVLFLYDAFGTSFTREYVERLKTAGVNTRPFRPFSVLAAHT